VHEDEGFAYVTIFWLEIRVVDLLVMEAQEGHFCEASILSY
jgi:hypothetical protein